MPLLAILLVLFLLAGSVLGWVAFLRISSLTRQLEQLRSYIRAVADRLDTGQQDFSALQRSQTEAGDQQSLAPAAPQAPPLPAAVAHDHAEAVDANVWTGPDNQTEPPGDRLEHGPAPSTGHSHGWMRALKDQWMIWLGGLSVSLSGIFLVRYSIEQGLLGPAARVSLGIITGLALHLAAEWMRRHNRGHYNAFAALAGGASITLYAALLAALLLYQLLPPWLVFTLLAAVSLFTLSLALVHGPVLAILGILGAYVVPLLVDTGSNNILGLYCYSLIITTATILLMRRVYRPWLWLGMLAGSLGWWFLSLLTPEAEGYRGYYVAALAYLYLALPSGDWTLHAGTDLTANRQGVSNTLLLTSLALVLLTFGIGILAEQSITNSLFHWTPLVAILAIAGGSRPALQWLPVGSLVVQLGAWLSRGLDAFNSWRLTGLGDIEQHSFMVYAGWMVALYTALFAYNALRDRRSLWVAMTVMTPLAWLSLCYLLVTDLSQSMPWGAAALLLGIGYLAVAAWRLRRAQSEAQSEQSQQTMNTVWFIVAGHFAYSLAVAIAVREATLTLALAAQLVSLTWLMRKFHLPALSLLIKGVLGVVVARLTFNPWLLTYPGDIHWSLWTYGGSTLLGGLACRLASHNPELRRWLEAATLHLLVLTLWAETRYWLYDGNIFAPRFELLEFAINTAVWSTLALVYHRRYLVGQLFAGWYRFASRILLLLATISYALVLLPLNPAWSGESVASTPIFNQLLLAYGYPVLICLLLYRYYEPAFRRFFGYAISLTGFIFVNLEIRHLWQGSLNINLPTGNGELYTYTIVWLIMAILALLAGSIHLGKSVYKGGMALLLLVVAKIFLVDMADLEGLLRVASFMGLGLSLLGLAYLYQRFNLNPDRNTT